jgi:hypothetical protein
MASANRRAQRANLRMPHEQVLDRSQELPQYLGDLSGLFLEAEAPSASKCWSLAVVLRFGRHLASRCLGAWHFLPGRRRLSHEIVAVFHEAF